MTRFNKSLANRYETKNYEGGKAFSYPEKERELYALASTTVLGDTYYQSWKDREDLLKGLIAACDYRYVADLAYYLRKAFHLRSIPLWIMFEKNKTSRVLAQDVARVIQRADEITEFLALYQAEKQSLTPLPSAVREAVKMKMRKFSAYQFRKYDRQGKGAVSFQDVMRMIRPKPANEEMSILYRQIAKDELPVIESWETLLSAAGDDPVKRKEAWETLIAGRKIPYFAMLRNLRNMIKAGVDDPYMAQVCNYIANPEAVAKSQLFPFRWFAAYLYLEEENFEQKKGYVMGAIYGALEAAIQASMQNVLGSELFSGKTLIACDVSGSMNNKPLSPKGKIYPMDVGLVLGHLVKAVNKNTILGTYSNDWIVKHPTTVIPDAIRCRTNGGATYTHRVLDWACQKRAQFDRLFFLSDNQAYADLGVNDQGAWVRGHEFTDSWRTYKNLFPEAKLYMFDLQGYSTVPVDMRSKDVYLASGWSENIFKVISDFEGGKKIQEIVKL